MSIYKDENDKNARVYMFDIVVKYKGKAEVDFLQEAIRNEHSEFRQADMAELYSEIANNKDVGFFHSILKTMKSAHAKSILKDCISTAKRRTKG